MIWRKKVLQEARLYLVLDTEVASLDVLWDVLKDSVQAGVNVVQLRSKKGSSREVIRFCERAVKFVKRKALFIVNDRVDWAFSSGADGVHIGQDDVPLAQARAMLGKDKLVGVSCQTLRHAVAAQRDGADYLGFGSVFKTKTKPDREPMDLSLLTRVAGRIKIPVFFIGGITGDNISSVLAARGKRVAVTRSICLSPRPAQTTREFLKILQGHRP